MSFLPSSFIKLSALSFGILSLSLSQGIQADPITEAIENALKFGQDDAKYGQIKFDLRYRYENDDTKIIDSLNDDGTIKKAPKAGNASTIRLRLGYLTPDFYGFQAYAEYEGNQDIGVNDYNSGRNGKGGFEAIIDPQEHELNQLWLSYKGIPDTEIKVGRQRIILDNARFIGNVGWRQMEQTFDSVLATNKSLPNTTVKVGYINQTQRIFSTVVPMETPFLNIAYNIENIGTLTAYGYWMDFEDEMTGASNQTYGISFDGGYKVSDEVKALYRAEYAYQADYENNPTGYETDYFHFIGGLSALNVTAKVGVEQLGGKGAGKTFNTPLATAHAFNGWSDQFLGTPTDGLRDVYASLGTNVMGVKLLGVYHEFMDDSGSMDYGKEWDFVVAKKFAGHYSLLAKYAYFDGNNGRFDAQNFWIGAGVSF